MSVGPVLADASTEAFFAATSEGRFLIKRCLAHGHPSRPQSKCCDECASPDLRYDEASGRARLISWVVVPARSPADPPLIPAIAELEEGPWWWSKMDGADPASLREGLPLRIEYQRGEGGEAVPVFAVDDDRPS